MTQSRQAFTDMSAQSRKDTGTPAYRAFSMLIQFSLSPITSLTSNSTRGFTSTAADAFPILGDGHFPCHQPRTLIFGLKVPRCPNLTMQFCKRVPGVICGRISGGGVVMRFHCWGCGWGTFSVEISKSTFDSACVGWGDQSMWLDYLNIANCVSGFLSRDMSLAGFR